MSVLVTGGAGYIGSHATLALLEAGFDVVVLDNLCNSSCESLKRVASLAGREPAFVEGDIRDSVVLHRLFSCYSISAVMHFAALKSVGESASDPLRYYDNNVNGSQVLLRACVDAGVFNFVFSSSATVYGDPVEIPVTEVSPLVQPTNPYGRSKLIVENILSDLAKSDERWRVAILRYFNPVGAHESGFIGEDPNGIPNNLLPYISQVAVGKLSKLAVYGNDYPTPDGTGVRDYIHVMDLVEGHLCALEALQDRTGVHVWNLGTGHGYSVLEMVRAFEAVSGKKIPFQIVQRRSGDIAVCYSDPTKAEKELGWKATRDLSQMIYDAWHWQSTNPNGFK